MPAARQAAVTVGKRAAKPSTAVASSHTQSVPVSAIRRVIAAATTSRGARSASGCAPAMNRATGAVAQHAALAPYGLGDQRPVPRAPGRYSTVGWNCTNSRSAAVAPARRASAIPSPVDVAGLVVVAKSWP